MPERLAEEWLGETCYVGWPHMVEALVVGVCDGIYRCFDLYYFNVLLIHYKLVEFNCGVFSQGFCIVLVQMLLKIKLNTLLVLENACGAERQYQVNSFARSKTAG